MNNLLIGNFFFKYRSYTPLPLIAVMIYFAQPTVWSITAGFLLIVIGGILRSWGVGYATGSTRTTQVSASELVLNGPYAYLRNPLYLGNFILSAGICLSFYAFKLYLLFIFTLMFFTQYYYIIQLEENYLLNTFRENYRHYLENVPRFFPTFHKYSRHSSHRFNLTEILKSEKNTWISVGILWLILFIVFCKQSF